MTMSNVTAIAKHDSSPPTNLVEKMAAVMAQVERVNATVAGLLAIVALAGSGGSYGFPDISTIAREGEHLLVGGSAEPGHHAARFGVALGQANFHRIAAAHHHDRERRGSTMRLQRDARRQRDQDRDEDRLRGLSAGADYYLTKGSFHDETLLRAVEDLIGEPET